MTALDRHRVLAQGPLARAFVVLGRAVVVPGSAKVSVVSAA